MFHLTVKKFGVLKDINIELNETNLFIGNNSNGKSTLAKLITVITDFTLDEDAIIKRLQDFNIDFLNKECFIELKENGGLIVEIVGFTINFSIRRKKSFEQFKKHGIKIKSDNLTNKKEDKSRLDELLTNITKADKDILERFIKFSGDKEYKNLLGDTNELINNAKSKYIPVERNLISLFNQSLSNMLSTEIPLPKTLLEFSTHYGSARNEAKELGILGMKYKNENTQDRICYENGKSFPLENSSNGIQSPLPLPLYLTLKYFASIHKDIIIEEPEKASNTNNTLKDKVSIIISQEQQINPDSFSAYLIKSGVFKSIKSKSTGMIQENFIDDIGGILDDDYNKPMGIYREFEYDI